MPIYMDRHDVSDEVTAEVVAKLHQEDLKVQQNFNCRGLTYWFDDNRKTAFCLVEAPNKQSLIDMHNHAHGIIPHRIIEVDETIVESFLGRIEDPDKAQNTSLNIINDPAFRTIMVAGIHRLKLNHNSSAPSISSLKVYNQAIVETIKDFNGRLVKQNDDNFLVSFESVSYAINCALKIQSQFKTWEKQPENKNIKLKIGLSAGIPVTEKESIFEDTIKLAERLYYISEAKIMVSDEVKALYKSENLNVFVDNEKISALNSAHEVFLNLLMEYIEKSWNNPDLQVEDFGKHLGYSKSQLYRKMVSLTGKSPNTFIKEYRLNRALKLIHKRTTTISEIAFESGFSSPSYFTKCFQDKYGLNPSDYLQTMNI